MRPIFLFNLLLVPFFVISISACAQAKDSPPSAALGTKVSECGKGNPPLWMTRKFKPETGRDVYRSIAESLGAIRSTEGKPIDTALMDEKLKDLLGETRLVCELTLKPSGRVQEVKILDSSGDPQSDKKAIRLLKNIGFYGADRDSHKNLSYQVELPKLRLKTQ